MSALLQGYSLIDFAERDILNSGHRSQMSRANLVQLRDTILKGYGKISELAESTQVLHTLEDVLQSIEAINALSYDVLPATMKQTLEVGVRALKKSFAEICYQHYLTHEMPINENTIPIFREIVSLTIGG